MIAERTRDAIRHKVRTGSQCGKVRYGSHLDSEDPRCSRKSGWSVGLAPRPAEAEAGGLMRELAAGEMSLRGRAAELTLRGVATKEGRPRRDHSTVRRILSRHT